MGCYQFLSARPLRALRLCVSLSVPLPHFFAPNVLAITPLWQRDGREPLPSPPLPCVPWLSSRSFRHPHPRSAFICAAIPIPTRGRFSFAGAPPFLSQSVVSGDIRGTGLLAKNPALHTSDWVEEGARLGHIFSDETLETREVLAPASGYLALCGAPHKASYVEPVIM